jgi:serine/threonine protein kinase
MSSPEAIMIPVSPRHSVLLAPEYAQLIRSAPEHDYVMRTITRREANGLPLMSAEMVIAGKDTRAQFPLAEEYPMHFRKTYFPGRLHGDPSSEFDNQSRASEILDAPPPIGWTRTSFRSCFVPGKPYSRLTPFGTEPVESNVSVAREIDLAKAVGLWWLCNQTFALLDKLHRAGMVHGDMELHNIAVAPAPAEAVLIDFELAKRKADLSDSDWHKALRADFTELLKEAVYLQCALGRQPGPLADMAMEQIAELFPSPGLFERTIRRQASV